MFLNYDPEKIEKLCTDFYIATGVKLGVCDQNFNLLNYKKENSNKYCTMIQEKWGKRLVCRNSDHTLLARCKEEGRAVMHICHAGLVDLALPIIYKNNIIAYLILGQIRTEKNFPTLFEKDFFPADELEKLENYYNELSLFDQKKIESISYMAVMMVKYILFENILNPKYDSSLDRALSFINQNFEKKLTISEISESTLIPKSSLYKFFNNYLGCTVSDYINLKKIEKATELLLTEELSISEISEKLGFSTQQYFSKAFKKLKGISPSQFRKNNH